jgi:hypothetical protein
MVKSKLLELLECGSCGGVYAPNHWLKALCPTCSMIAAVYLTQSAPRAKKSHFIKNVLILAKLLTLEPEEQMKITADDLEAWLETNYEPYVMLKKKL